MNKIKYIILTILLFPTIIFGATNDFVAGSDFTVADVTFGSTTADMTIFSGSTAGEISFDAGVFTVTNPASDFKIGSSDSTVKSMQISKDGAVVTCSENSTAGTSYATLPTGSGTYTIRPSATTDCADLCTSISHTSTYNTFPTCGSATCSSGYLISGSGANATCVSTGNGPIFTGTLPTPENMKPRMQTVYPDGTVVYADEVETKEKSTSSKTQTQATSSYSFLKNLSKGLDNQDVINLQQKLRELNLFNYESNTGYYGTITETAVKAFQCKYDIVCEGTPYTTGYGVVGPKTREKLNSLITTISETPQTTLTTTEALEQQINELQKLVEDLLKELEEMLEV